MLETILEKMLMAAKVMMLVVYIVTQVTTQDYDDMRSNYPDFNYYDGEWYAELYIPTLM